MLFSYVKGVGYVKLTDKQKKEIIAKYVSENVSQRELAKSYHVSKTTISKILNNEKVYQSISNFEDENTLSMLAYVNEKRGFAQWLITIALESVEGKLKDASLKDTISAIEKLSNVFKDGRKQYVMNSASEFSSGMDSLYSKFSAWLSGWEM